MQPRFEKRVGNAPYSLLEQPRFRAGFDFLRLRGQIGEIDPALGEWWEKFSTAYDDERHDMIEAIRETQQKKPQAPRTRVKRANAEDSRPADTAPALSSVSTPGDVDGLELPLQEGDAAPAKKRRRRRKPAGRAVEGQEGGNESPVAGASPATGD